MFNLITNFAIDTFEPIAKWLALGCALAVLVAGVLVFFLKKDNFKKYAKLSLYTLFVFLLVLGITCLVMEICKKYSTAYADENGIDPSVIAKYLLIPITCLLITMLASAIAIAVTQKKSKLDNVQKNVKTAITVCGIICVLALVFVGVMLSVYFETVKEWYPTLNQAVLYVSSAIVIAVVIALAIIFDKSEKPFDTRCIATAGICVAMSFGLSYVKLWDMPQGGSVTLVSLLPIMIFSNIYGTKKGVFVCFLYGVLQSIQDPWIIHPAQFILDYPIAFASVGVAGMFAEFKAFKNLPQISFMLGGVVAGCLRFICHVLSGVFAFATGDTNPWLFSLAYNSYVFIDIALVIAVGMLVFSSKPLLKELKK